MLDHMGSLVTTIPYDSRARPSSESVRSRWSRRALTWTLAPLALVLLSCALPLLALPALIADALGSRPGHLRALLVMWIVLAAETAGLAAGALIWATSPQAGGSGRARYEERNRALQAAWIQTIFGAVSRLFPLELEVSGAEAVAKPGALIVLSRHSSLLDTLLPAILVAGPSLRRLRYVLKQELLWDPCLDLVGQRLPNAFVARGAQDKGPEVARIGALGRGLGPTDAVLIYPEGTRFSPQALERARAWARAQSSSALGKTAEACRHVLPPRLPGTLALLQAAPQADVLVVAHTGLEALRGISDILRLPRAGARVQVRLTRIPAAEVPRGSEQAAAWLQALWLDLDRWVESNRAPQSARS